MLTPVPMKHVTLYMPSEKAHAAALILAREGVFDPLPAARDESFAERPASAYRDRFVAIRRQLEKALEYLDVPFPEPPSEGRLVDDAELEELDGRLQGIWQECSENEAHARRLNEERRRLMQLRTTLGHFETLDVDLGLLQQGLRFLDVRIGTVPLGNVARLRQAISLESYSLTVYMRTDNTAHIALAGLAGREQRLRDVLRAASFRPLEIPPEFHDYPAQVRRDLEERARTLGMRYEEVQRQAAELRVKHGDTLQEAARRLMVAAPYAELSDAVASCGGLACLSGWVPASRFDSVSRSLRQALPGSIVFDTREPRAEEWSNVPSAPGYPRWLSAFGRLVRNYGVPRYGEVDPTWLLMLTFVLMYGMMFGDVGNGLVIAAAGVLLHRRLRGYGGFAVAAGLSSMAFGFVHGTVFGFETWVEPLWHSPLSAPVTMMQVSVGWGAVFILLATAISVRNQMAFGRRRAALMDGNGVAGMVFYMALLLIVYRWFSVGAVHPAWFLGLLVPAAVIAAHCWRDAEGRGGERVMVTLVRVYESLAGYVTQNLSFLRLAAFSLNHAALTVAVFTLAGLAAGAASAVVIVLGNLVVLVLEGGIVAVQALRLEYYEGFSRFFGGDGRRFRPLALTVQGRA